MGQSGTSVDRLNRTATLSLSYPDSSGHHLRIFQLSESTWTELDEQTTNTAENSISAQITSPGVYRLAEPQTPWDVTSDHTVNIFDLVAVAREFGKTSPDNTAADVNGDGIVNIFDLILVAAHFGE